MPAGSLVRTATGHLARKASGHLCHAKFEVNVDDSLLFSKTKTAWQYGYYTPAQLGWPSPFFADFQAQGWVSGSLALGPGFNAQHRYYFQAVGGWTSEMYILLKSVRVTTSAYAGQQITAVKLYTNTYTDDAGDGRTFKWGFVPHNGYLYGYNYPPNNWAFVESGNSDTATGTGWQTYTLPSPITLRKYLWITPFPTDWTPPTQPASAGLKQILMDSPSLPTITLYG